MTDCETRTLKTLTKVKPQHTFGVKAFKSKCDFREKSRKTKINVRHFKCYPPPPHTYTNKLKGNHPII